MSGIERLRYARARIKTQLTKMLDAGDAALRDQRAAPEFEVRYERLGDFRIQLDELQSKMEELIFAEGSTVVLEDEENAQQEVMDITYSIQMIQRALHPPSATVPATSFNANQSASVSRLKLSKLTIPTFSGETSEWTGFADLFRALVHSQPDYSPAEKFHYLKQYLSHEPLRLIRNLQVTDANYEEAWKILERRYDNPRLIIHHHINKIVDLPEVRRPNYQSLNSFLTELHENLAALRVLNMPVDEWDQLLLAILLRKVDLDTRRSWELENVSEPLPTVQSFLEFLENNVSVHRCMNDSSSATPPASSGKKKTHSFLTMRSSPTKQKTSCVACRANHQLYQCSLFKTKPVTERLQIVRQANLCANCLSSAHPLPKCRSTYRCRFCQASHHSLLHQEDSPAQKVRPVHESRAAPASHAFPAQADAHSSTPIPGNTFHARKDLQSFSPSELPTQSSTSTTALVSRQLDSGSRSATSAGGGSSEIVLLGTARVAVTDAKGKTHFLRALIDCASQHNYVTAQCAEWLNLPRSRKPLQAYGLGMTPVATISEELHLTISAPGSATARYDITAAITDSIGGNTPQQPVNLRAWEHLQRLQLADPLLGEPGRVDLLIGAKLFPHLLLGGRICGPPGSPSAIETTLGWLVIGEIATTNCLHLSVFYTGVESESISETLQRFWEVEEIPETTENRSVSSEEARCEELYKTTVVRDETGRYTVTLPFREEPPILGDSYRHALACYKSLRRRLRNDPSTKQQYDDFLVDFLEQGHMRLVPNAQVTNESYFIPHLSVLRPDSTTTKLRVVFNASKRSSNGVSLNDTLLPGQPLQSDIRAVLLRFRTHRYAFTGDLKQMFRQIRVAEPHLKYQRILWNFEDSEVPQVYELTVVTFGMCCSPFLAMRTLKQLAIDENARFPSAATVLVRDSYVDDVITGSDTLDGAVALREQLTNLCEAGKFLLRKFAASNPRILPKPDRVNTDETANVNFDHDSAVKVLGVNWSTSSDTFTYSVHSTTRPCTKRVMLSEIARVFDPLGWLTPVTMSVKRLLQILWTLPLDWDDTPPADVEKRWIQFQKQLPTLAAVQIPRYIGTNANRDMALIGFCDASEVGYAAVVYSIPLPFTKINVPALVCAKGRVAPLKRLSIPRLELCAAVILARLLRFVRESLNLENTNTYAFSDSTVALTWIGSMPYRWKTFVSNRVTEIQEHVPPHQWFHVRTTENPADIASRGALPLDTLLHPLWWSGPCWLRQHVSEWPLIRVAHDSSNSTEARAEETTITLFVDTTTDDELLERYSSLPKLLRVIAYCHRFINACRKKPLVTAAFISVPELATAMATCVRLVQAVIFREDLAALRKGELCSTAIRKLNPFLDEAGIIRVGGRLRNAVLPYEHKHPQLLPSKHNFTSILIDHYHKLHLHAGPQALHALLATKYWILSAKQRIRSRTRQCLRCFRANPPTCQPKMGDLPEHRVINRKAFEVCGTDMAGPLNVSTIRARGVRPVKAYVCIFVCFTTKAVHLELVSDLSTDAFLAAFRRFTARRGPVRHLYSDCGRNFVGAHRFAQSPSAQNELAIRNVTWHFNPPSAPHFGGLWEAGVKAVKYHLKRVVGMQILTYEEMTTLLAEIEAQLNSRPLVPESADPNDLHALTPAHFLGAETADTTAASRSSEDTAAAPTLPKRWALINALRASFWSRWRREYLHTLQQRSRWSAPGATVDIGHLVLVKDDNLPPTQWKLGRVTRTVPGSDGVVRVAEVRTADGLFLRPVVKLAPLPSPNH